MLTPQKEKQERGPGLGHELPRIGRTGAVAPPPVVQVGGFGFGLGKKERGVNALLEQRPRAAHAGCPGAPEFSCAFLRSLFFSLLARLGLGLAGLAWCSAGAFRCGRPCCTAERQSFSKAWSAHLRASARRTARVASPKSGTATCASAHCTARRDTLESEESFWGLSAVLCEVGCRALNG